MLNRFKLVATSVGGRGYLDRVNCDAGDYDYSIRRSGFVVTSIYSVVERRGCYVTPSGGT